MRGVYEVITGFINKKWTRYNSYNFIQINYYYI